MIDIHTAIYALNSSVATIRGEDAFDANDNPVTYNKATVQAYIDAHAYIEKRVAEYPPIGDQLDAIWKGGDAQADMLKQVMAVKTKYPK